MMGQTIERHRMLAAGDRVVVAVSGGVDSMVLLDLLVRLCPLYRAELHAAHLDHGLRGSESAEAAEFVRRHCEALGVPATIQRADPRTWEALRGGSRQDAARIVRYRFLEQVADEQGAARIAVGHHLDDQAETVLLNLLRGTGTRGLGGMVPVKGRLIRPLYNCARDEIEAYARSAGIPHVEDSSNRTPCYRRNRLRLQLLPELRKWFNPRVTEALAAVATIAQAEDALLEELAEERLGAVVVSRSDREVVLSVPALASLPPALARRVLRRSVALVSEGRQGLGARHTLALERLLCEGGSSRGRDLPGGIRAVKEGERLLVLGRAPETGSPIGPVRLLVPGRTWLAHFSMAIRADLVEGRVQRPGPSDRLTAVLDADLTGTALFVRPWRPGDRFVPLGMRGRKKLQDFFVDAKVPRHQRARVPLVLAGDAIVWVVGLRVDERYAATSRTTRALRLVAAPEPASEGHAGHR
jgi:tRNA(Ile)-lysidine synthase